MLNESEILKLIKEGENSFIEFKREITSNKNIAKELTAFANHKGGILFIGVEDKGVISGITREGLEERIINVCCDIIKPSINPIYYEKIIKGERIAVVEIEIGINKPYYIEEKVISDNKTKKIKTYFMRRGSTAREVTERDELQRLFQASRNINYEAIPVYESIKEDIKDVIDFELIRFFYLNNRVKRIDIDEVFKDYNRKVGFLTNKEILIKTEKDDIAPTIAGLLLMGRDTKRYLPQSGITVVKYEGVKKEYNYRRQDIKGHLINLMDSYGEIIRMGAVEQAIEFVKGHIKMRSVIDGSTKKDQYEYPLESIREAVVNAVAHRDYTITGVDISVDIFSNRIEIKSPGSIPNTLSIDKMKVGAKYYRNQILCQFLREAGFMDMNSLGIPDKIIELSKEYTGKEPVIEGRGEELIVILFPRKM